MEAIETGGWLPTMRGRLEELEARKAALTGELAKVEQAAPAVVLHPNAAEIYRERVAELELALNKPELRAETTEILRGLIERVVLTPDQTAPDRLRTELHGDIAMIAIGKLRSNAARF
jgi:site-specific DNA recombinase